MFPCVPTFSIRCAAIPIVGAPKGGTLGQRDLPLQMWDLHAGGYYQVAILSNKEGIC